MRGSGGRSRRLAWWAIAGSLVLGLVGCAASVPAASDGGGGASASHVVASPGPSAAALSPVPTAAPTATPLPEAELARMIGQKLIVRIDGLAPSQDVLGRVRRGEIGGVILFGFNIRDAAQVTALTDALHAAADEGGQPRLLVAVDQEGGGVKRIPWAPPDRTPAALGRDGRAATARAEGVATGRALRALGITLDLAPVADVPADGDGFMARAGRTYAADPEVTARVAVAFAEGLESAGVLPAMKHFPGIGMVARNTDRHVVTVRASRDDLEPDLVPYRAAIARDVPLVMLSNATYAVLDADAAAGWSRAIGHDLLRGELGFTGATITDSLDGTANARGVRAYDLAERAAIAGTDLLLLTGSEGTTRRVFEDLVRTAVAGDIPAETLVASDARIAALKARLATAGGGG